MTVTSKISRQLMPSPAAMALRMPFTSPSSPLTTCGVDMTAEREKETMPNRARALFTPCQPEGRGLISDSSVATNSTPITAIMELTAIFSQTPTSFMPTNTTPAPTA